MDNDQTHAKTYHVTFSDVDPRRNLKISNLFNFFQDTASLAIDRFGYGVADLKSGKGLAWILTRLRLEVFRMPEYDEHIRVTAWYQDQKKWDFRFDFLVEDGQGRKIAGAVTTWMILDIETREICTADQLGAAMPPLRLEDVIEVRPGKLKPRRELREAYRRHVGYSDLDLNGHLNNARYLDYALDGIDPELLRDQEIRAVEVDYLGEAFQGDELRILSEEAHPDHGDCYVEVRLEPSGKTVFRCLFRLERRKGTKNP